MNEAMPKVVVIPANPEAARRQAGKRQLRVAAYCRVSTDDEEQLTSYEAQKTYYTDKIMTNPEWTMAGVFADEGISGTSTAKRKDFNRLIKSCRQGKVDIVMVKSISRFARNTLDCIKYIRMLKALGVAVIFEKENINTLEMDSELLVTMMGAFAQAESKASAQTCAGVCANPCAGETLPSDTTTSTAMRRARMESPRSYQSRRRSSAGSMRATLRGGAFE